MSAVALALCSGVMLAFALPPRSVTLFAWLGFLPLLVAARAAPRPLFAMGCGLMSAAACGITVTGVRLTLPQFGNMVGAFGGVAAMLMIVAGLTCWATKRLKPWAWALFVPCTAVAAEMVGVYIFPVSVGIALYRTAGALALASLTGIWGVSFVMWLVPASMVAAWRERRAWPVFVAAAAAALIVTLLPFPREHTDRSLAVAAIQAPDEFSAAEQTASAAKNADVVVCPEHVLDADSTVPAETARKHGIYVAASFSQEARPKKPHNTARLIAPDGRTVSRFQKQHLFGRENLERSPGKLTSPKPCGGMYGERTRGVSGVQSRNGHAPFCAGIPICFDTEFTDVCRNLVRQGADILLVPNHDPAMPGPAFHHLHRAAVAFRAAENGAPIVWSECNGLSCIFDSHGRMIICAGPNEITARHAVVTPATHATLFTRMGDWFAYLCIAGALALAAFGRTGKPIPKAWLG